MSSYSFCFVFFINSLHSYSVCCNVRIYWNIEKYCVKSNVVPTSAAMKKKKAEAATSLQEPVNQSKAAVPSRALLVAAEP